MEFDFYALSHPGMQRPNNEDFYTVPRDEKTASDPLFLVADGMGGHRSGEVASKLAVETFTNEFYKSDTFLPVRDRLNHALKEANAKVYHKAKDKLIKSDMGTTLVACHVENNRAVFLNVGDSRAYIIRNEEAKLITQDHSVVNELIMRGEITPEQAEFHPQKNVITKAIGIEPAIRGDIFIKQLEPGDCILLCSDGLTNHIPINDVGLLFESSCTPEGIARALLDLALIKGGSDNITIIVIRCK